MGQQTGIDIAWARPTVAQIKATGATWVARYFSNDVTKNLTPSEVTEYTAAGLGIVTVWEATSTRALQGFAAGAADAQTARAQRANVGLPDTMPIHFAVDTDTPWAPVAPYFQGVVSVLGLDLVGVYGGLQVIEGAHAYGLRYLWQTVAWSGGLWAPYATIRQPIGTTLNGGADYDYAEVPDFGQYPRPEVDMPLTPDDITAVVNAVWNHTETDANGSGPVRMGAIMAWMDKIHGNQTAAIAAVKTELDAVNQKMPTGVPQLTDAQVAALAAQLTPVLVPAFLAALGHKLDGTA